MKSTLIHKDMDFQQQQMYEFQMKKKKLQKKQKKSKRDLKKAIQISHTQQTDLVEGYYEVESIQKIKSFGKYDLRFFVKWKGWNESDNTWEPFQNLRSCFYNLREFYAKSIDNKKITNTDAWKMFIGCLKRENLIDEKGIFKEDFKRKYNRKKKDENNLKIEYDIDKKSVQSSTQNNKNSSDSTQMNLKIETQEEDNESEIQFKQIQKEIKDEKKAAKKKKVLLQQLLLGHNLNKIKEGIDILKQKRKYKKRNLIDDSKKKKDDSSLKKKKLKKTYSSTESKRLTNQTIKDIGEEQTLLFNPIFDIEMKIEEGADEYDQEINQFMNSQNRIIARKLENNISQINYTPDLVDVQYNYVKKQSIQVLKKTFDEETENKDPYSQIQKDQFHKEKLKYINLKNLNNQKYEKFEDVVEDEESQNYEYQYDQQIYDREENKDEENIKIDKHEYLLKQRKFHELKQEQFSPKNQNTLKNDFEPNILKKRKLIDQFEFSSAQTLTDNKQFNSYQELEMIQPEGQYNQRINDNENNNLFGSNNVITSGILTNPDQLCRIILNQQKYTKQKINDQLSMEGSISGKNLIPSFDNIIEDQIGSDNFLDKLEKFNDINSQLSMPNYITKNSHLNGEKFSLIENQTQSEQLNKTIKSKKYDEQNDISLNQLSNLPQNTEFICNSSIDRIISSKIQQNSQKYDNQVNLPNEYQPVTNNNVLKNLYSDEQFLQSQKILIQEKMDYKNTNSLVNKQETQSQKTVEIITIEDDDVIENTEQTYKLQSEKDYKDKFTKFRLIKKHDSIEIQQTQPYKHKQQFLDELQKKRINSSNYNDIQGQSCGFSKNLGELSRSSQPQLKNQYNKFQKDHLQSQSNPHNNSNGKSSLQKQSSETSATNGNGATTHFVLNDQTYKQFVLSQFQEVKHLKNFQEITDPQRTILQLYIGNLQLKDEPTRIISMDVHPYLVDQFIFRVCWQPRKKKDQLISSWVEGEKLKLKYPKLVFDFYESFIRFID